MIYFDSSYIVRLYFEDSGFRQVRELAETDSVACSLHGRAEVAAALHRKYRENYVTAARYRVVLKQFYDDSSAGAFNWLAISQTVVDRVENVYGLLPSTVFLRSADALHLACAAENRFNEIYSNDEKLLRAATYFGLKGINVI